MASHHCLHWHVVVYYFYRNFTSTMSLHWADSQYTALLALQICPIEDSQVSECNNSIKQAVGMVVLVEINRKVGVWILIPSDVQIVELLNIVYCLAELLEFAAFVALRYRAPDLVRPYRVPLPNWACVLMLLPATLLLLVILVLPIITGSWQVIHCVHLTPQTLNLHVSSTTPMPGNSIL